MPVSIVEVSASRIKTRSKLEPAHASKLSSKEILNHSYRLLTRNVSECPKWEVSISLS